MGMICMQEHADKFKNYVNDDLEKGAEIIGGGKFGNLAEGIVDQFCPPTVNYNIHMLIHRLNMPTHLSHKKRLDLLVSWLTAWLLSGKMCLVS